MIMVDNELRFMLVGLKQMEEVLSVENYRKGEVVNVESRLPFDGLPADVCHMQVKAGSRMNNLLEFALRSINVETCRHIVFSGCGNGITKTISCVELMKRKIKNLHQMNKITYEKIEEIWEPVVPDLDRLKVTREIPAIYILLSKDPIEGQAPDQRLTGAESKSRPEVRGAPMGSPNVRSARGHKAKKPKLRTPRATE